MTTGRSFWLQVMVEPASLAAMSPRRRSRTFRPSAGQLQLGDALRTFRGGSDSSAITYGAAAACVVYNGNVVASCGLVALLVGESHPLQLSEHLDARIVQTTTRCRTACLKRIIGASQMCQAQRRRRRRGRGAYRSPGHRLHSPRRCV